MQKFIVLYMAPASALEEWMKTDMAIRKPAEDKMRADWDVWMKEHGTHIKETAGAGKTKRVTKDGITDIKNDVMMFSIAEGESQDAVAQLFAKHPHFGIPGAWIDIMPANYLSGMEGM